MGFNSAGPAGKQVHNFNAQLVLGTVEQNGIKIPLVEGILNGTFRSVLGTRTQRNRGVYYIVRKQVCAAVCEIPEPIAIGGVLSSSVSMLQPQRVMSTSDAGF